MPSEVIALPTQFADTLAVLTTLSRDHLLYFRLEVGRMLLDTFFGGDPRAYQSLDRTKPHSFAQFTTQCAQELADIGLHDQVLRQCVVAHIVVAALPKATAAQLGFTRLVELTRVSDAATRSLLAQAAIENAWTSRQLKDAAAAVRAGRWPDADPDLPGLQPPLAAGQPTQPDPNAKPPQLGRVVTRFEKAAEVLETLGTEWRQVAAKPLSQVQKERLGAAVVRLEQQLVALRAAVGG